ncbi:MAG: zf-TFIIB domain-containing protein, partial [Planctomycetales bacterium]|nr:zf-TFIIB domain-containing protein [Planctomycetales bacterium]
PQCRGNFVVLEIDGQPLDYCRRCHSWWFDAHELEHFTELCDDANDGDRADRPSSLHCPTCSEELREQPLRINSNLLVHNCPQGHGIFLEDGEFIRALEDSDRVDGLVGHLNDQHLHIWHELQAKLSNGEFEQSPLACRECGEAAVTICLDGIDIDYCTQCQSCWFDAHELQHFTGQTRDVPGDFLTSRETDHRCPRCSQNLRLYQFMPKNNLMVEA